MERVGYVKLQQLARTPARHVQELVVQRKVNIGDQGRHCAQRLQRRRQRRCVGGFCRNRNHLGGCPFLAVPVPQENRTRQVFGAYDNAAKTVVSGRVVRRPQFQRHLMLRAQINNLLVRSTPHVPEVDAVAVILRHYVIQPGAMLKHLRRSPFAGHHRVQANVPPEVIGELLRAPVQLPRPDRFKRVVVQHHDSAGPPAVRRAQGANVDGVGATVNRMGTAVAGPLHFLGFDGFHDAGPRRVRLRIDDVDPAAGQCWHHQISPFQVRVGR